MYDQNYINSPEMRENLYDIFMKQDYKNEFFDVIFYVDGREFYAHAQTLAVSSPIFKKQLLQNRSNGYSHIQINNYTYEEFFEFIRLIYSPFEEYNNLEDEYIYVLTVLNDDYKIQRIHDICNHNFVYVVFMEPRINDIKDVFKKMEFAQKYSLTNFKEIMNNFLEEHFFTLIEFDGFINLEKSAIKAFLFYAKKICNDAKRKEKLFKAIYKWGEYQSMITVEMPEKEKNQLILHQINDILSCFNQKFLFEFVVDKGLYSENEKEKYYTFKISVKSGYKSITGTFIDSYGIYKYIQLHEKDVTIYPHGRRCIWYQKFNISPLQNTVQQMKGVNWYLLFDENKKLNIKHRTFIKTNDYLIAEMKEEGKSFVFDPELEFDVTVTPNDVIDVVDIFFSVCK